MAIRLYLHQYECNYRQGSQILSSVRHDNHENPFSILLLIIIICLLEISKEASEPADFLTLNCVCFFPVNQTYLMMSVSMLEDVLLRNTYLIAMAHSFLLSVNGFA